MKHAVSSIAFSLLLPLGTVWADDHASPTQMAETADAPLDARVAAALAEGGSLVTVDILGMVCDFCALSLQKSFGKRDEVAASHVDLGTKKVSIVLKAGQTLDDATILKIVEKAGYKADGITRDA